MKKLLCKSFSLLLVCMMLVSMLSTSVSAQTNSNQELSKIYNLGPFDDPNDIGYWLIKYKDGSDDVAEMKSVSMNTAWDYINRYDSTKVSKATLFLKNDVTTSSPLTVNKSYPIVLDLDGHTIDRGLFTLGGDSNNSTLNGEVFLVQNNGNLTIDDYSDLRNGKIMGGNNATGAGGIQIYDGTVTLEHGNITENNSTLGSGVVLSSDKSVFRMDGGTISNNGVLGSGYESRGGGISIYKGSAVINGGNISGNNAEYGGGIYLSTSQGGDTLTLGSKATVSGNSATYGGGICLINGGSVLSGSITNNIASSLGGGIYDDDDNENNGSVLISV